MSIVLASASPRRRELLSKFNIKDLKIIPAKGEEKIDEGTTPWKAVCELSLQKATEVARNCDKKDVIFAADTVVALDGKILGKPKDYDDAKKMLLMLSDNTHKVYTGVTVIKEENIITEYECTDVSFRELSENEISAYISSGEPMDKAGAYGAQGIASVFVQGINGDFFNVMGLPMCRLSNMLMKLGVRLI